MMSSSIYFYSEKLRRRRRRRIFDFLHSIVFVLTLSFIGLLFERKLSLYKLLIFTSEKFVLYS